MQSRKFYYFAVQKILLYCNLENTIKFQLRKTFILHFRKHYYIAEIKKTFKEE